MLSPNCLVPPPFFKMIETIEPTKMYRNSDPNTSRLAAEEITRSGGADLLREAVLAAVKENPGCTSREFGVSSEEVSHDNFHKRLPELEKAGEVHRGDARKCRITNRQATTWYPGHKGDPEQMDFL